MYSQVYNSKLYQLLNFLNKSSNEKKDIIIAIPICNQTGQERCDSFRNFCFNLLEYLPEANKVFTGIRICSYAYYNTSAEIRGGGFTENKEQVLKNLESILARLYK